MKDQTKTFRILKASKFKGKIQNRFRESDCLLQKDIETQEYFLIPLLILKMRTHCLSKLM
jgi:hypothetical protein